MAEKGKGVVYDHAAMLVYYRQGLSDPEIARKVGCTACNVYKWRKYNGLPPNVPAHGGYGRPVRIRDYNASLNHGSAETFCAYGLITGHSRIKLPKREDGRCPGFASTGVILGGEDP